MKNLVFHLPEYLSEPITIKGKSSGKYPDGEKSAEELKESLKETGIYCELEESMITDYLTRTCDLKELKEISDLIGNNPVYFIRDMSFYKMIRKAISQKILL